MKKTSMFLLLLLLMPGFLLAQESTDNKTRISSFSTSIGFNAFIVENTNTSYMGLKSVIDDDRLFIDVEEYKKGQRFGAGGSFSMQFNLGITPFSKKKNEMRTNREWRIGLITNMGNRRNFSYYNDQSYTFDTLQSNNGYNDIYADSVSQEYFYYNEQIFDLSLNLAYLINTGAHRRVYFYSGIGTNIGMALKSDVSVYSNSEDGVVYYDPGNKPSSDDMWAWTFVNQYGKSEYESSTVDITSNIFFGRAYIPLGINFRISNNNEFWKHVNLYAEFNPGIEFQMVSNDKTYINPYFGMAWIGISYKW